MFNKVFPLFTTPPPDSTRDAATPVVVSSSAAAPPTSSIVLSEEGLRAIEQAPGPLFVVATLGAARRGKSLVNNVLTTRLALAAGETAEVERFNTSDDSTVACTIGAQCMLLKRAQGGTIIVVDAEGSDLGDTKAHERLFCAVLLASSNLTLVAKGVGDNRLLDDINMLVSRVRALFAERRGTATDATEQRLGAVPKMPKLSILINLVSGRVPSDSATVLNKMLQENNDDYDEVKRSFRELFPDAWAHCVPAMTGMTHSERERAIMSDIASAATPPCLPVGRALMEWCARLESALCEKVIDTGMVASAAAAGGDAPSAGTVYAQYLRAAVRAVNEASTVNDDDIVGALQMSTALSIVNESVRDVYEKKAPDVKNKEFESDLVASNVEERVRAKAAAAAKLTCEHVARLIRSMRTRVQEVTLAALKEQLDFQCERRVAEFLIASRSLSATQLLIQQAQAASIKRDVGTAIDASQQAVVAAAQAARIAATASTAADVAAVKLADATVAEKRAVIIDKQTQLPQKLLSVDAAGKMIEHASVRKAVRSGEQATETVGGQGTATNSQAAKLQNKQKQSGMANMFQELKKKEPK